MDLLLRYYCTVTFENRYVPGVQHPNSLTNQDLCKGNETDVICCLVLYCWPDLYAGMPSLKSALYSYTEAAHMMKKATFKLIFSFTFQLCICNSSGTLGTQFVSLNLGNKKCADVHQVKSQAEINLHSPVQQLISLTLTELLKAWEATIEIILISDLRQGGRRFGGR